MSEVSFLLRVNKMPRKPDMTQKEIIEYLRELRVSAKEDLKPFLCLRLKVERSFALIKLVLTYVDYLGALYCADLEHRRSEGPFATGPNAVAFLEEIFGKIDPNYSKWSSLLWTMYRHGTVHLDEPLCLEYNEAKITWTIHTGDRKQIVPGYLEGREMEHLVPLRLNANEWILPISERCLYEDLIKAISLFIDAIRTSSERQERFVNTVNALCVPQRAKEPWWQQ
jgi:hypothetical protein